MLNFFIKAVHLSLLSCFRCDLIYSNNTEHKHRETDCDDTVIYEKETLLHIEVSSEEVSFRLFPARIFIGTLQPKKTN